MQTLSAIAHCICKWQYCIQWYLSKALCLLPMKGTLLQAKPNCLTMAVVLTLRRLIP